MELGVCVADMGRGTQWNPLRRPTSAVAWPAQGRGTQWNLMRRPNPAGVGPAKGHGTRSLCCRHGPRNSLESVASSILGCCLACTGSRNSMESVASSNPGWCWACKGPWHSEFVLQTWAAELSGIRCVVQSSAVAWLAQGRGTQWNPLRHPTPAGVGIAKGHGTQSLCCRHGPRNSVESVASFNPRLLLGLHRVAELNGIRCVVQPRLVLGLQRAMELGVCVADTGRGTRWNPLRRPTSAVDWTAQGHGTQWNPLRHQTSVTRMLLNSGNTFLQMRAVGPIGIHLFIHHWRVLAVQREL